MTVNIVKASYNSVPYFIAGGSVAAKCVEMGAVGIEVIQQSPLTLAVTVSGSQILGGVPDQAESAIEYNPDNGGLFASGRITNGRQITGFQNIHQVGSNWVGSIVVGHSACTR